MLPSIFFPDKWLEENQFLPLYCEGVVILGFPTGIWRAKAVLGKQPLLFSVLVHLMNRMDVQ